MNYKLIFIFLLINIPFIFFHKKISLYFNLYDKKKVERSVPITGGLIIIYNFFVFILINYFYNLQIIDQRFFTNNREFFSLVFAPLFFYFFGYLDDKYDINANIKLFLVSFFIIFTIFLDNNFIISKLSFSFLKNPILLFNLSTFMTVLSCLLFINAINMFDGIDLQAATYSLIILSIFIFKSIFVNLSFVLIFSILLFLFFNFKSKSYLGNSGIMFLGYLFSFLFIKTNNLNVNIFKADEIFVIMMLPGLDLLRLFCFRIINNKHPFKRDNRHIHHLMLNIFSHKQTYVIIQIFIVFSIFGYYLIFYKLYFIVFLIIFYSAVIYFLTKKIKKKESLF
jgi:UDP-GlcNAc:undecaprenyl-phosphate GlcNAc-1-phosphate transferase